MRNLKSILGVIVGVSIVFAFAGIIHGANLWFSHALYIRDVESTVQRLERELYFALSRDSAASNEARGAEPSTLDGWQVRGTNPTSLPSVRPDGMMDRLAAFASQLGDQGEAHARGIIWFETAGSGTQNSAQNLIPLGDAVMDAALTARIEGPVREARATGSGAFSLPQSLGSDLQTDKVAVIALPITSTSGAVGAVIVTLDLTSTISFMNDFVQSGVAIVIALCLIAMLIATIFVWMRFRDRLKASKTIQFLAHHDALTGLPNRTVFSTKLNEALRLANAKATNVAVMLIDVDKFKQINDTYGHAVGDLFLQVISDRLRSVFGDHLVARLSGDEFAVLITSVTQRRDLTRLAATMIEATRAPTRIDGKDLQISLSIGIAQAREAAWRTSRILHCADLALYRSKHSGRSTFKWYSPDMDEEAQRRKELEGDLRTALEQNEFRLLYQPQFSLSDQRLTGYETLLRWHHPDKGTISPSVFIPIAEDSGLIEEIGAWVLNRACEEAAQWQQSDLSVAVNVSPAQFRAGMTEKRVATALQESGLDPARLEIEITESLLISDTDAVVKTLSEVRNMGVSVAMDDFGTGYSSLSYLSRFPFDTIKIDRTFVATLGKNRTTDAVVASIVGLGRSLGVTITAEGVENEDQVMLLRAAGCDKVQGFLFGRPMDLANTTSPTSFEMPAPLSSAEMAEETSPGASIADASPVEAPKAALGG